jgi:hypothetical protein
MTGLTIGAAGRRRIAADEAVAIEKGAAEYRCPARD